jgi:hypothetical protein
MKLIVIVPLIITIDVPAKTTDELYDDDKSLRREDLLNLALEKIPTGPDVEVPEPESEGVIFLDENEDELDNDLGPKKSFRR